MRNGSLLIFTCVYALMTAVSVVFMARTLFAAKQSAELIEMAANERLIPIMAEMKELEGLLPFTPEPPDEAYMLGLHEGYIAVFFGGDGTRGIKEVTNTPISSLPREEWLRLTLGIKIENDEALSLLLQDYGS